MRFLKYEKLLSGARTGVPLSAEVGDVDGQASPRKGMARPQSKDAPFVVVRDITPILFPIGLLRSMLERKVLCSDLVTLLKAIISSYSGFHLIIVWG